MVNPRTNAFTVTYRPATTPRAIPDSDSLEERWLHQLFLLVHRPATWPAWKLVGVLLVITGIIWYAWLPLGVVAFTAAGLYLGFALADWLLLSWLPQSGHSFGPVGSQLLIITVPRLGVAVFLGVAAWIFGWDDPLLLLWLLFLGQLAGTAIYLWGSLYEPFALEITQKTVRSPAWPVDLPPLRLLHISDLHVERLTRREAYLLELVDQIQPDLIVITGDYLNLSYVDEPAARTEVRKLLERLYAPFGVYAVLGSPLVDPRPTTPSLFDGLKNIRLLRDEIALFQLPDGRRLSLIGLDCDHELEIDGQIFKNLVNLAPADSMRILLYHSPELMPLVQQYPVDLYLCGHTHGGQMRLPLYGAVLTSSALGKRYEIGPYTEQGTTLYISRGIGLEGLSAPRMRLLCPPEIILFNLGAEA